ncbi:hypothetical protein [Cognatiluteimonas profundi]|uniref:hypothetical protein n=1 Tax=Cognatiluteimonas profundi TaxID=2594501 RepID=UPI00131E1D7E|nr:hypothetical protein [Lysobacter profundi]
MTLESRSTIRTRLVPILLLATLAIAGWLVIGGLLFRSGLYYRYLASPDSTAGEAERALLVIQKRYRPGARNVLVLGDSRTNEGFSSKLANHAVPGINFIEAGMAGTTPRVWYYLLRKVDPDGDRFAAIVLVQICDATFPNREDLSERPLDLAYLPPLLTLEDGFDLPASFHDAALRKQAWRTVLLPIRAARSDLAELAATPHMRFRQVRANLRAYADSRYDYAGHPESLAAVRLDPSTLHPVATTASPAGLVDYLDRLEASRTSSMPTRPENQAYYRYWISRIAGAGHRTPRRVFVATLPRGPFHQQFGPPPRPSLQAIGLSTGDGVALLAPPEVAALERPEYFFDGLHMDSAGRNRYSVILAQSVAAALRAPTVGGDAP